MSGQYFHSHCHSWAFIVLPFGYLILNLKQACRQGLLCIWSKSYCFLRKRNLFSAHRTKRYTLMTQGPQWKVSVQLHEKANTSSPVPKEVRDSFPRIALENRALIQKQHFWEGEKQNKNPGCLAYIQVLERVSRCNSSEGKTNSSVPASSKRRVATGC